MTFETPEDKGQIDDRRYKQPENSTDNLNHRFIIAPFSTGWNVKDTAGKL